METTVFILIYVILFLSTLLSYPFLRKKKRGFRIGRPELPPGSMGWPYVGETLQLYSQDPNLFFLTKQRRYGEIFKTQIFGCPCVMLASPEAARFVLVTHAHLFKPTYPKNKEKMIGPCALFFRQGEYHTRLKLVQISLSPDSIRKLIPDIERIALSALDSWAASEQVMNTFSEMKKFAFNVGILSIFGHVDGGYKEKLEENYRIMDKGYNSFPTRIPGSAYHKALQDTTASVITWILKFLHDDPKLLEAVKTEQKAIHQSNNRGEGHLTWAQTRKMTLTHRVLLESLRMASIISFTFREAVVDMEYKGYLIPKGWKVMPLFRNIHHNPDFFSEPQHFDPSRFEAALKPNTFMPGNELAKLEAFILIHHLVTRFRWEVVGCGSGIKYGPFPVPQGGLPARFWEQSSCPSQDMCP
ncbi:Abscisic acid 8'-hydroxylase 1 [Hibiscus syriacus]|uniref:Abscisic acid 8'-hydroxylase 1 n=1 Tax=Hibiscus syriacus TaxID=106335 RepID=A0A6A2ZFE6_HIBSY|nr:Abscisic acid 8'-hydroxylase 1 [Hibiscus syriacus]